MASPGPGLSGVFRLFPGHDSGLSGRQRHGQLQLHRPDHRRYLHPLHQASFRHVHRSRRHREVQQPLLERGLGVHPGRYPHRPCRRHHRRRGLRTRHHHPDPGRKGPAATKRNHRLERLHSHRIGRHLLLRRLGRGGLQHLRRGPAGGPLLQLQARGWRSRPRRGPDHRLQPSDGGGLRVRAGEPGPGRHRPGQHQCAAGWIGDRHSDAADLGLLGHRRQRQPADRCRRRRAGPRLPGRHHTGELHRDERGHHPRPAGSGYLRHLLHLRRARPGRDPDRRRLRGPLPLRRRLCLPARR